MHTSIRGIVKIEDSYLLIHRKKLQEDGTLREYYVIPGGKQEKLETDEETLIREMKEEVGIKISVGDKLFSLESSYDDSVQIFYSCNYVSGEIGTGDGEEKYREYKEGELFQVELVPSQKISSINLVPIEIKDVISE
jgi:mutator protein MutT